MEEDNNDDEGEVPDDEQLNDMITMEMGLVTIHGYDVIVL